MLAETFCEARARMLKSRSSAKYNSQCLERHHGLRAPWRQATASCRENHLHVSRKKAGVWRERQGVAGDILAREGNSDMLISVEVAYNAAWRLADS